MKKHQIIPRRFRPRLFAEVIGQEHIVHTIKNALRSQLLGHAYLFSGSRGTGKTTLARIFSKAMNCSHRTLEQEPCNQCDSCTAIDAGRSLDVLELDAASNRGIDDIRKINDTVAYSSSSGRTKIYIIDEVHMLTKEAFNALLKTLEEPPARVVFLLATTEAQKILPTVLSRCQKFSLQKLPPPLIKKKLQAINSQENLQVSPEVISLIANHAEGSLRDAEILLEQVFLSEKNEKEELLSLIGCKNTEKLLDLDSAIIAHDLAASLAIGKYFFTKGIDLPTLILEILEHFHTHLRLTLQLPVDNLVPSWEPHYRKINSNYTTEQTLQMIDLLIQWQNLLQEKVYTAIHFEILMVQMTNTCRKHNIDDLYKNIPPKTPHPPQAIPSPPTTSNAPVEIRIPPPQPPVKKQRSRLSETLRIRENLQKTMDPSAPPEKEKLVKPTSSNASLFATPPPKSNIPPPSIDKVPSIQKKDLTEVETPTQENLENTLQKQKKAYYDTVVNFAAVELEGSLFKGEDYG